MAGYQPGGQADRQAGGQAVSRAARTLAEQQQGKLLA